MPSQKRTADSQFNKAFRAFQKHIHNKAMERAEEVRKGYRVLLEGDAHLGNSNNLLGLSLIVYRVRAGKIGEDFMLGFDNIIKPYGGSISNSSKQRLISLFNGWYASALAQAEQDYRERILSMGTAVAKDSLTTITPTLQGYYHSSQSKYLRLLDEKIEVHNLEHNKTEQGSPVKTVVSLEDAKKMVRKLLKQKKWKGKDRIEICKYILEKHSIKDKPNYTAEQLNNLVSQQLIKETNQRPASK